MNDPLSAQLEELGNQYEVMREAIETIDGLSPEVRLLFDLLLKMIGDMVQLIQDWAKAMKPGRRASRRSVQAEYPVLGGLAASLHNWTGEKEPE